jgi:hypothetical protein
MNFNEQLEERIAIDNSARNTVIAKLIVSLGLTAFLSFFFISSSARDYEKGKELTRATYIAQFEEHKTELISKGQYSNDRPLSVFTSLLVVNLLLGSYELVVLILGLLIGKLIR